MTDQGKINISYEMLCKADKRKLRKEFTKAVECHFIIMVWCSVCMYIIMLMSAVCLIFTTFNYLFIDYYITQSLLLVVFISSGIMSLVLVNQYFKRYNFWLKECKNIIRRR